jgi:diguanylate cyclase (GGDEF)-like protein
MDGGRESDDLHAGSPRHRHPPGTGPARAMTMHRPSLLSRLRDRLAALLDLAPPGPAAAHPGHGDAGAPADDHDRGDASTGDRDPGGAAGGGMGEKEMAAIGRCAFEATAACLDQVPPPTGDALRRDTALADETAAQLGLPAGEAAALHAAFILTRLDAATRARLATPDAVTAQRARAEGLRADADARPGATPAAPPVDPLTRLPLLPFLFGSFEQDLRRAESLGRPLTLIQLDIDDFGALNERYGRAAGDRVLRGVARAIRSTLRPGDTCVRCAGDEFVITVPGVGEEGIAAVLARVETAILRHKFAVARGLTVQVGVTIGAAAFPADGRTHEALLAVAEARRLDRLFARRRRPEDADKHVRFPGRPDVPVN